MKAKKWIYIAMAATLTVSAFALAACGDKPAPKPVEQQGLKPTEVYKLPIDDGGRSTDVSVHDPSVFYDENSKTYYAFGSHFMVASSKDLIEWTQEVGDGSSETSGQREAQKLYGEGVNWRTVLKESVAYAGSVMPSTWAPDVNYHDGKYYMYYSLTSKFGSPKSVIGRVSSKNVLGPYADETIILKTPDDESGKTPNAIDPELFTDKDGGLWMVYGSAFAGVYIKELYNEGENWGLPKEEGYGKLLWKGGGPVVEGPFVFYNELTDYYYLMTTYGDLNTNYNMRIARSENPDGPYLDITGADMATTSNNGNAHGNKVAGSYHFGTEGAAYAALGHNSVVKDTRGKWFVVYHARRQTGTSVTPGHNLYTSQLFFNEDGWPVMSPLPYVGEKFGKITKEDAAGEYEIVVHSTGTAIEIAQSVTYNLTADGKVLSGTTEAGSWDLSEDFYITITLNNVEYKGVIVPGWNSYISKKDDQTAAFAITAISKLADQGGSLWGVGAREDE